MVLDTIGILRRLRLSLGRLVHAHWPSTLSCYYRRHRDIRSAPSVVQLDTMLRGDTQPSKLFVAVRIVQIGMPELSHVHSSDPFRRLMGVAIEKRRGPVQPDRLSSERA